MAEVSLFYDEMESPLGTLLLVSNGKKMVRIDYGSLVERKEEIISWAKRYLGNPVFIHDPDRVKVAKVELTDYFAGNRETFTFSRQLYGTDFQKKVWQALFDEIPFGETKTYKDIAVIIGNPKAVRAVGGTVRINPFSIVIPCHRVIGTNGKMVGYNGGLDKKEFLLNLEANKNILQIK